MPDAIITRKTCGFCLADLDNSSVEFPQGTRRISIVDRDKDCVTKFMCPDCRAEVPRSLGEILAVADPSAFKEI